MVFDQVYITMDELANRGWSLHMTKLLYGEPDKTYCMGVNQKIFKYFNRSKIYKIEKSRKFKHYSAKHMKRSLQRSLRKLTIQARDACRFCKEFNLKIQTDCLKRQVLYAICKFDDEMMHKTGCRVSDSGRAWHREIPSSKMLAIILRCIRDTGSNYGCARKYIDTILDKSMNMGVEFREYRCCVSILNETFRREVFSKIPDIIEHYENIKTKSDAISIYGREACKVEQDMQ